MCNITNYLAQHDTFLMRREGTNARELFDLKHQNIKTLIYNLTGAWQGVDADFSLMTLVTCSSSGMAGRRHGRMKYIDTEPYMSAFL